LPASPSTTRTSCFVGRETILRNGEPVGYLTSGGYGYTLGKNIGYGYVAAPGCRRRFP
jgi:glycine cleavage system aminomethyltransferase T